MRIQYNLLLINFVMVSITSQLLYYYNNKRGVEPTFIRVLSVMSGSATPASIGLYSDRDIKRLLKYKTLFSLIRYNSTTLIPILGFIFGFTLFALFEHWTHALLFGTMSGFHTSFMAYSFYTLIPNQILCLHIVCAYLKVQLNLSYETTSLIISCIVLSGLIGIFLVYHLAENFWEIPLGKSKTTQ